MDVGFEASYRVHAQGDGYFSPVAAFDRFVPEEAIWAFTEALSQALDKTQSAAAPWSAKLYKAQDDEELTQLATEQPPA